jgi:RHS repeat-associated protein
MRRKVNYIACPTVALHIQYDQSASIAGFGQVAEHWAIDANGETVKMRVDGGGRPLEKEDQDSNISTFKYDANGNQLEARDANGVGYDMVYDELNRLKTKTDTYGDTVSNVYDKAGNLVSHSDAKSNSTLIAYDAIDRRKQVVDRISGVTQFTYDLNNKLTSVTDAESKVTAYEYDDVGQKIKETYDDHTGGSSGDISYGIREFTYDPAGKLKMSTDQKGDTVTYVRNNIAGLTDARETRTKTNSPSGTTSSVASFTYASGRMATASMSGPYTNSVTNSYDDNGFLESQTSNVASVNYTVGMDYDFQFGRINELTMPDSSTVEFTYNDRGLRYETKYNSTTIEARDYDAGGRLTTSAFNNGVTTTYSYRVSGSDKDNMLAEIDVDKSSTTLDHFTYTYDENKNKLTETRTGTMSAYSWTTDNGGSGGYDDEDRLTYWKLTDNSLIESISLSAVGNRSSVTVNSTTETNTFSDAHELTNVSGGSNPGSLVFDPNGNLVTDNTKGHTYQWNIEGQLISSDTDADTYADVTFEYDALGRRVKKGNNVYIYHGYQVVSEYTSGSSASAPNENYVYGTYIDEPLLKDGTGGIVFYHHNGQYSVSMLTDSSGNVVERYSYTAEGDSTIYAPNGTTVRSSSNYANHLSYTGRPIDLETGLFYFRLRYYMPGTGSFISRDPIGYVDGSSLYLGYFLLRYLDPLGLSALDDENTIGVFFGGTGMGDPRKKDDPENYALGNIPALSDWHDKGKEIVGPIGKLFEEYKGKKEFYELELSARIPGGRKANDKELFDRAKNDVCFWFCSKIAPREKPDWGISNCPDYNIDIFGYSKGAILAHRLAKLLNDDGCNCARNALSGRGEEAKVFKPIKVRFLGLFDPVIGKTPFADEYNPGKTEMAIPPNVEVSVRQHRSRQVVYAK